MKLSYMAATLAETKRQLEAERRWRKEAARLFAARLSGRWEQTVEEVSRWSTQVAELLADQPQEGE